MKIFNFNAESKFFGAEYQAFKAAKKKLKASGCTKIIRNTSPRGIRSILGYQRGTKQAIGSFSVKPNGETFNSRFFEYKEGENKLNRVFKSEVFDTDGTKIIERYMNHEYDITQTQTSLFSKLKALLKNTTENTTEQKEEISFLSKLKTLFNGPSEKMEKTSYFSKTKTLYKGITEEIYSKNTKFNTSFYEYNNMDGTQERIEKINGINRYVFTDKNGNKKRVIKTV